MSNFYQAAPQLENQYLDDAILKSFLKRHLPKSIFEEIHPDLVRFGSRVISDIMQLGISAEESPPKHIPFDPWGKRIDQIVTSAAWKELD